ncbi:MAG TPA: efflux RND transporter periplasmic adaptor subunit [Deferrisomatales bacterium]|nr:efflux RND transporter periplasmic adaptor subunit [Deferrisomatales bacterium]
MSRPTDHDTAFASIFPGRGRRVATGIFRAVLAVGLLAGGGAMALHYLETAPEAKKRAPSRRAALVEVEPVRFSSHRVTVEAMGTVVPARVVELHPRVSGEVVWVSGQLAPGGLLRQGEPLLRLDTTDYELALQRLRTDLARAEADLAVEQGNQAIARREFELLGEVVGEADQSLLLRKPQLDAARAAIDGVQAEIARAEVELERTTLRVPFNALVRSRAVDVGARVTQSTVLATLVGTDTYWVEAAVPVRQLKWLDIPRSAAEQGPAVRVFDAAAWGEGRSRTGRVVRLAAELQEAGRMARLLVAVEDPLGLHNAKGDPLRMLLGSFVRVAIDGQRLARVAALERPLLRPDDTVWVRDGEGNLDIRPVEVVFRHGERVMIASGLAEGEQLVVSDLPAPVQGMPLRLPEMESQPTASREGSR